MKYIQNIVIRNESKNEELFNANKDYIDKIIKSIVSNSFNFDIAIKVTIKDAISNQKYVDNEVLGGATTFIKGIFYINLTIDNLQSIKYDSGIELYLTLYHELGHIYDMHETAKNPECKIELLSYNQKNFDDFELFTGFSFWTEIFAYYFTFEKFKKYHNYPTINQLVKYYKNIQLDYSDLCSIKNIKSKTFGKKADKFLNKISIWLYACAKHISGVLKGVPKKMEYGKRITQTKEYKDTEKLLVGFAKYIGPLFVNTHGKLMIRKLRKLGSYIIINVYLKFNIEPVKHDGYVRYAFFRD